MTELLSELTEKELQECAAAWRGANYCEGELGDCDPQKANWRYEAEFSVDALLHLTDWSAWFTDEIEMDELEEMGRGYRAMLTEEILEPIVVLVIGGKGYIWDGWHRTGATIVSGRTKIRAVVGRLVVAGDT